MELSTDLIFRVAVNVVAIVAVIWASRLALPKLYEQKVWRRILPIVPLLIGAGAVFLYPPDPTMEAGGKVMFGVINGLIAAHGRKTILQGIMGRVKDYAGKK